MPTADEDRPREIRERPGALWLCEFVGGALDGFVEVHQTRLARRLERRWYPMNGRSPALGTVYVYELVPPLMITQFPPGRIEYMLVDVQPSSSE